MQTTPELQLANDFVAFSSKNIFLTGRAGTGKTTFLHQLKAHSPKRMIVVAPTGVAAINAGGVTIHSFFQLPLAPFLPTHPPENFNKMFRKEKINIIKSLDLIVIDEVSMVRADVLDAVDAVLRRFRRNSKPFGGVQLLMIGDLQQLPPVVKDEEWNILKTAYQTPYFFSSQALNKTDYVTIELKQIFRQRDENFIDILNRIRNNQLDLKTLEMLNLRHVPDFQKKSDERIIQLTTHRYQAQDINQQKLNAIPDKEYVFEAQIDGDFPEWTYPVEKDLKLKLGAQVMFAKTDTEASKQFYNGKIGEIIDISEYKIVVKCPGDDFEITVPRAEWKTIRYEIDDETKAIREHVVGTFTQHPLRLAWAMTIHKSQGLTFDKVAIDARAAFAHGQVYVALSRCKTLEGVVLTSKIDVNCLHNDQQIRQYTDEIEQNQPNENCLQRAKLDYQRELLFELYDLSQLLRLCRRTLKLYYEHPNSVVGNLKTMLSEITNCVANELIPVTQKFQNHLNFYLSQPQILEGNQEFQTKIKSSQTYFSDILNYLKEEYFGKINFTSDNKEVKSQIKNLLEQINNEFFYKLACFNACKDGFFLSTFVDNRAKATLVEPKLPKAPKTEKITSTDDVENPELFEELRLWRKVRAEELDLPAYCILHTKTLVSIVNLKPQTLEELAKIKGFGKTKIKSFGAEILEILEQSSTPDSKHVSHASKSL
ncbi:MAG: HRDC domain-containing protein [Bacteroidales bacterium]|nr:HRDC domain-containing protein [Bacteroidales bacterium]